MKKNLLFLFVFLLNFNMQAQAPQIEGDILMCPWTDGTASITTSQTYDSYQWYFKYWFLPGEYEAISGATGASLTYDWYTYDQALLKVVVTLDGSTFESNVIQVDSWNWVGLVVFNEMNDNVTFDPDTETFLLCEGTTFELSINNPPYDTNIVWYKNDTPIAGATQSNYMVTEPGYYYVIAAPSFCPDNSSNSLGFAVAWNPDCSLSVTNPNGNPVVQVYPNPAKDKIRISSQNFQPESYSILDVMGKVIQSGFLADDGFLDISKLSSGMYLLQINSDMQLTTHKIIKE
ncbi:T9SS type A sorting domain-containing protein [Flavobacterium sp. UBA6135]|uniref:T9SS type A sorting domain-containing protein n=1 Tax=Flavobacterium sp. UBA6135 TaxID=1946553 RepID=UPI0025C25693|nr:T9SS type A sorting domain-containing protein [Flavobacterium sp. UBA6135]